MTTERAVGLIREALEEMGSKVHYCQCASWWPDGHLIADPMPRHVELLLLALDDLDPNGVTDGAPQPSSSTDLPTSRK